MRWVKIVMFQTSFSKILKNICKQENIGFEIKVVIIANSFTIESIPNIECVLIVKIRNILIVQLWKKNPDFGGSCVSENFSTDET